MKLDPKWSFPPPPPPPIIPEVRWNSYIAPNKMVPWGYFADPHDDMLMHPIPRELELLELAKKYMTEYSYTECAEWLTKESSREITPSGLMYRIKNERNRKAKIKRLKKLKALAEEAAKKIEKYENLPGGFNLQDIIHRENCTCSECTPYSKP